MGARRRWFSLRQEEGGKGMRFESVYVRVYGRTRVRMHANTHITEEPAAHLHKVIHCDPNVLCSTMKYSRIVAETFQMLRHCTLPCLPLALSSYAFLYLLLSLSLSFVFLRIVSDIGSFLIVVRILGSGESSPCYGSCRYDNRIYARHRHRS